MYNKEVQARFYKNHIEERRASARERFRKNKDKVRAQSAAYRKTKTWRDRQKIRSRRWRKNNLEKARAYDRDRSKKRSVAKKLYVKQDRLKNPLKYKIQEHRKRARKRGAAGKCSVDQWAARIAYYGWRCAYCHKELTIETVTQDHRIPLIKNGSNWPANLVPACLSCNCSKQARKDGECHWKSSLPV